MKYSGRSWQLHTKTQIALATGILLLAALLRIYNLNEQGLWGDEGWSVEFSEPGTPAAITKNLINDLHPPLYFIGLGAWRQVAGDSEVAMRMLAVWAALITVALIIRLGYMLFSRPTGVAAGLVLALADKHTLLAQEVRHYPLAFMWMAASSVIFLRWLKRPTRTHTLMYAVLVILSLYTHYYTAMIFIVQVFYALLFLRPWTRVYQFVGMLSLASLAFLPWSLIAIHQIQIRPEGILHSLPLTSKTLDILTVDYLGRPVFLMVALMTLGLVTIRRYGDRWQFNIRHRPQVWYAVLWLAVPIGIAIAVFDYVAVLTDRNMALVVLPIALLAGHGITSFRPSGQVVLAVFLIANGLTSLDSYSDHPPWREMAIYVAANYPEGEPVVMDVRGGDKALVYHLRRELPPDVQIVNFHDLRFNLGPAFENEVETFLESNTGLWVAYWGPPDYELEPVFERAGYTRTATHTEYHLGNPIVWYHYDRVPGIEDRLGVFDGKISLHQVKAPGGGTRGETMNVSLWWSTSEPLAVSYSISVFLLDENGFLRAQHDGPPQGGQQPTTSWPTDTIIFDTHGVEIPADLSPGDYRLAVKVYDSLSGEILVPSGPGATNDEYLVVDTVTIR